MANPNYAYHEHQRANARIALANAMLTDMRARIEASGPGTDHDMIVHTVIDLERTNLDNLLDMMYLYAIDEFPTVGNQLPEGVDNEDE